MNKEPVCSAKYQTLLTRRKCITPLSFAYSFMITLIKLTRSIFDLTFSGWQYLVNLFSTCFKKTIKDPNVLSLNVLKVSLRNLEHQEIPFKNFRIYNRRFKIDFYKQNKSLKRNWKRNLLKKVLLKSFEICVRHCMIN
jgi:hypothetical protein